MLKSFRTSGFFVLGVTALALAGCDTANQKIMSADQSEVGPYPAGYRQIARDYLRKTLLDPYSVRDPQISRPKAGRLFVEGTLGIHEPGWLVCFRGNAKNRMGAYTGVSDTALVIRDNHVLSSMSDPTHSDYVVNMICDKEAFESFPDISLPAAKSRAM